MRCIKLNWKRVFYFIAMFIIVVVDIVFLMDLVQAVTTAWTPIEVKFVSSEEYLDSSDDEVEVKYRHRYQGTVNGEVVTFTESDQILETGNDRMILVNLENPKEYEMFSNEQSLLAWKLCAMVVAIFVSAFLIRMLNVLLVRNEQRMLKKSKR